MSLDAATLQLGQQTGLPASPEEARLDRVPNPHAGTAYLARFTCPEFTSICPVTGQPDFGILVIDYLPGKWLVESKSLKLYLGAFRNHGAFHEDCTIGIGKTLVELLEPEWFRIGGYWYPRGGIPIDVFWQTGEPPKDKNGKSLAADDYVGPQGLRGAVRWGEARKQYGDINYVTLNMEATRSSGPFSQNQKLVNGRTMGVFVTVYGDKDVLKGAVTGEP